jgi:hypothetical protein
MWKCAGPSTGISEEGLVREDRPLPVFAPQVLPVGQDVEVEDSDTDDPDHRLMFVCVS